MGNEARCSVIKQAAKKIINKGVTAAYKKLGGDEMCAADAAEAAAMCELVGFGPEDPFADECAVALAVGFEMACKEAVKKGVAFTADQVMNHINGCHGDSDKDAKQKL